MFIEPKALQKPFRSSGARLPFWFDNTLRSHGTRAVIAVIGYKHLAALRPGPGFVNKLKKPVLVFLSQCSNPTLRPNTYQDAPSSHYLLTGVVQEAFRDFATQFIHH
jgi:hypothetical protein